MVKDAKLLWAESTHQSEPKCMRTYAQQPSTINRCNDHVPNKQAWDSLILKTDDDASIVHSVNLGRNWLELV